MEDLFGNADYVIVGSGFYGAVLSERIANDLNKKVLVIDKNYHIGGNCYSEIEPETGIEYHKYGTHIFHTSNQDVYNYLHQYCEFNSYYHQVLTTHRDNVYQMPINLETINSFFHMNLKPYEVDEFLAKRNKGNNSDPSKNFEEFAIHNIGNELYEAFIKGYTRKQWGVEPHLLPASIIKRLPIRKNYNESYFFDTWQGIPKNGYTDIFKRMLQHENISLLLNTDYFDIRQQIPATAKLIYTGAIDRFFDYCYGKLEWRSLRFENEILQIDDFQGTSVMNYADFEIPYTRIHEPKHLHPERANFNANQTLVIREYALKDEENPYYPISDQKSKDKLKLYKGKAESIPNLIIGGRLGDYSYYDMHHTIEKALETYNSKIKNGKF